MCPRKPPKKPTGRDDKKPAESEFCEKDAALIDRLCAAVTLEEICVVTWEKTHVDLDLTVPLTLTAAQAALGGTFEVRCSRCVAAAGSPKQREAVSCQILVPPDVQDGHLILQPGFGDFEDERRGDLRVIVRVKSTS